MGEFYVRERRDKDAVGQTGKINAYGELLYGFVPDPLHTPVNK